MRRALGTLLALLLFPSCASRGPSALVLAELANARTLVGEGCYRCLQDSLAIYERAAAIADAPPEAARGAFEAALLLTVRMKELGLPEAAALARTRALAAQVTTVPGRLPPSAYLDAVALMRGELSGIANEERERRESERRKLWPRGDTAPAARELLTPAALTDVVAQYLALALDCENIRGRDEIDGDAVLARYPIPLIQFRVALCGIRIDGLEALRTRDVRWVDTLLFEGRFELGKFPSPDVGMAAELLAPAHEVFPESLAITLALANVRSALSEHDAALALFDEVLRGQPTHREALLGRVTSLSYLGRHYDAIRSATRMIELGTFHIGDAYYWRAWNRYHVHELPPAWDDVEQATKYLVNTSVYTLAGFIAYARQELDTAIDRLVRAYKMDSSNCEAVWTEGLVHVDKQDFTSSAVRFVTAVTCFASAADQARLDIENAEKAASAEAVKARRIATARKRLETSQHRRAQSAFNVASSYLRLGDRKQALIYAEIAAEHPLMKEKATALKATVAKLPQ